MRFNEQWLREWATPEISTDVLAHQLTMAGLEVDAVEPVAGTFSQVVVGEVLAVVAHPDADKLQWPCLSLFRYSVQTPWLRWHWPGQ